MSNEAQEKIERTDSEWQEMLTPEQYRVARQAGTEPAFSGAYHDEKAPGAYLCIGCGQGLFDSEQKFDSGTGWPSFWQASGEGSVESQTDMTHGMTRSEVHCSRCGSHLGHVFDDGPAPTGLRYCINSASLQLKERRE